VKAAISNSAAGIGGEVAGAVVVALAEAVVVGGTGAFVVVVLGVTDVALVVAAALVSEVFPLHAVRASAMATAKRTEVGARLIGETIAMADG
jgi:hypothetical protein